MKNLLTEETHFKALADRFARWRDSGFGGADPLLLPLFRAIHARPVCNVVPVFSCQGHFTSRRKHVFVKIMLSAGTDEGVRDVFDASAALQDILLPVDGEDLVLAGRSSVDVHMSRPSPVMAPGSVAKIALAIGHSEDITTIVSSSYTSLTLYALALSKEEQLAIIESLTKSFKL